MQERITNGIGYLAGKWPLDPQKSTMVFIHGAGGSGAFWQAQVEGLAPRVNTVAVDLPGHGRSEGSGEDNVENYARAVAGFIRGIDMPRPIPCGLSMGGAITQQLLLYSRDQAAAGILIGTGARMKVAPAFFDTLEKDYNGFVDWLSKICVSKKTDPQKVHPFGEDMLRCRPEVAHGDFRACERFDVTNRLSAIDVPVLVVTAEDDKLTPPKYGEALEKGIKNATRAHIMDAGHIVPQEKPIEINKVIAAFLDQEGL